MANIMNRNNSNTGTTTRSQMPFSGLVDGVLNRFFDDDFWGSNRFMSNSNVPVNIRETNQGYEMEVVVPGVRKEDFNLNISNNMLTLSFEHKEEDKEEDKNNGYLRQEYRQQSFSRSFTLDESIDADKISAKYNDGVLRLSLPKKEGAQKITKSIDVK
jgi:HSP20 family protein